MKRISIVSCDKRFYYAKELLSDNGYDCNICSPDSVGDADIIILPPRIDTGEGLLERVFHSCSKDTVVFSGQSHIVKRYFSGRVFDYSDNEAFLLSNAYITAQCAIKLTFENMDSVLLGKRALVIGYGRIGRYLASMLKNLGAVVFVYARREESRLDAMHNGLSICDISEIKDKSLDLVYNTVPYIIIDKAVCESIPDSTLVMELASTPGGFEDSSRAIQALALPGKMMPRSAGEAIYCFVESTLSDLRKGTV